MKEPLINSDEEDFEHDDDFQKKNEVIIKMKIFLNVQRALNRFYLVIYLFKIDPTACLLYTSPSPRDGLLSRMPSSA